ncbi:fatty acyl-AMP ligase [Lyngbya confervoides]|uniref:Fatty acyl-AMP ligase n=1 Tax=Lyngbya confervoides BDU141951 TaxID=1574623 RepID=A0ABD4T855_9CYAN|nr:fatty acyl-AMP ligase [Lyngbya confervoides]MCM1984977.1 fatty acyl-AMP ligase [Lyngbya confervoides BDU141951]
MDFNPVGLPSDWKQIPSLVDLLRYRAQDQPDVCAYRFLKDGEKEVGSLTFEMLDNQARAIAAHLQSRGATGQNVLLTYPLTSTLEFTAAFFGCFYAGAIAVTAWPPLNQTLLSELAFKATDAEVRFALTTQALRVKSHQQLASIPKLAELNWIETDQISTRDSHAWKVFHPETSQLAYLQYSSGSTGNPKGAMITHRNTLNNLSLLSTACEYTEADRHGGGICWLPVFHDMGLVGGVLQAVYTGGQVVMMSPVDFILKPIRWLKAISRYHASTTGGPNFAFDLCIRKTTPQQRSGLDLGSWSIAINGAEPISAETLKNFVKTYAPYGFRQEAFCPAYGMSETTVMVSLSKRKTPPIVQLLEQEALTNGVVQPIPTRTETDQSYPPRTTSEHRSVVGCGQIGENHTIIIVNPETKQRRQANQVGEIWIKGPSVAQGYWNRLKETEETFNAHLNTGEGPFLRTGDLGFIQNNEVFVTGRLKDMIILWGRNHYPHHIEATVEKSHPCLRPGCGAAFGVEFNGAEHLVVAQEVESRDLRNLKADVVIQAIRQNLAERHAVEAHSIVLTRSGSTPKTPTGKIQRSACRAQFLEGSLKVIERWTNSRIAEGILVSADLNTNGSVS